MSLFVPIRFKTNLQITPSTIKEIDFDEILLRKLKKTYEGVCTRFGFIKPGSLEILKRSMGICVKQHFNGHFRYEVICHAEVCNPAIQSTIPAIVKHKNALGIHAESTVEVDGKDLTVLDILVPKRTAGILSEINLDSMQQGDQIYVQILTKKYQLYDKCIEVIGRAMKNASGIEQPTDSDLIILEREQEEAEEEYSSDDEESETEDPDDELLAPRTKVVMSEEEEEEEELIEEEEKEEDINEDDLGAEDDEGYPSDYGY